MKTKKLSLKGIKNVLSRAEMKTIMAGSSSGGNCQVSGSCPIGTECCPGYDCYDKCTYPNLGPNPMCYINSAPYGCH